MDDKNNEISYKEESNIEETNIVKPSGKYSKALKIIAVIIVLVIASALFLAFLGRPYNKADNTYKDVVIYNGATTAEVAKTLKDNNLIRSESSFKFISTVKLYNNKFKPGIYSLSASMSTSEIAHTLINGIATDEGFTIPSGYTVKQTAEALAQAGFVDKDKFIEVASSGVFSDIDFLSSIPAGPDQLEGYLMPGQYNMSKDADEVQIIVTMLNQFNNSFTQEYRNRASELGRSINDIVIIASIIECETNVESERSDIAAVIYNRLNAGMEPIGGWPSKPLCSPGIESIEAALYPSDSNAMYYVLNANLNGTHKFVVSEEEYNTLLNEYNDALAEKNEKDKE